MSGERKQCGEYGFWQRSSSFARHVRGRRERRVDAAREENTLGDSGYPRADERGAERGERTRGRIASCVEGRCPIPTQPGTRRPAWYGTLEPGHALTGV